MDKKLTAMLALAMGLAIGLTWPRTKKYVNPLLNGAHKGVGWACGWLAGFGATQKKRLGNLVAKVDSKKKKPAARPKRGRAKAAKA